jgi:hypothetical protein
MSPNTSHFVPPHWYSRMHMKGHTFAIHTLPILFITTSTPTPPILHNHRHVCLHSFEFPQNCPCSLLTRSLASLSSAGLPPIAWCSNSMLSLLFAKMSHLTSSISFLAPVLLPVANIQSGIAYVPSVKCTPQRALYSNALHFFPEIRPVVQCSPL